MASVPVAVGGVAGAYELCVSCVVRVESHRA